MVDFGGAPHDDNDIQDLWYALVNAGIIDADATDDGNGITINTEDGPIDVNSSSTIQEPLTVDTDNTELDIVIQDIVDALEQANNVSTNIDNQPIAITDNNGSLTIDTDLGQIEVTLAGETVSVDDDGTSLTVDTVGTELDIVVQDIIDALEGANNVSVNIDNQPISVDDNGGTITIDTDTTELDLNQQDIIDALEQASDVSVSVDNQPIDVDADLSGELVSVDDNGSSLTIDTDSGAITVEIGNEPISIDDDGSSITIDTTAGAIDTNIANEPISIDDNAGTISVDDNAGSLTVDTDAGPVSISDNGGSITIDTDSTEVDIVVQDVVDALEQASNISTNVDNQPIDVDADLSGELVSVDDNGTSLTIDTDSGAITVDIGNEPIDVDADLSGELVSVDDNNGSLTVDTDSGALDITTSDTISVDDDGSSLTIDTASGAIDVNQTGSVSIDEPISVDDNGSTITIDTDSTELDIVVQDIIDALEGAAYTNTLPQGGEHLKTRDYGVQPDGDLVGNKSDGQVFKVEKSFNVGEEFVSDWFDTDGFGEIQVFIESDEPSENDGLKVEYTDDVQATTPTVRGTKEREFTTESVRKGFQTFNFDAELDGSRVRYINNGTATTVTIITSLRTSVALDGANYVKTNNVGETFLQVGSNEAQKGLDIGGPSSLFNDLQTIQRNSVVDLSSSFGISSERDEVFTTGSGSITEDPDQQTGEIELSTGTTADSSIEVRSTEYGRYTPGFSAQFGAGIRIPNKPTEGEIKWGYFDEEDGFYWGYDGSQQEVFIAVRREGTEIVRVYKSNFNGFEFQSVYDRPFDVAEGFIFQIDFSWYGFGIINFQIVGQTAEGAEPRAPRQQTTVLHSVRVDNSTTISDPNQPITIRADNGGNGEDIRFRFGGRQFSVNGPSPQTNRISAGTDPDISFPNGSWGHIMSWQRRDANLDANAKLDLKGIDFSTDQSVRVAVVIDANIGSTSFATPDLVNTNETLVERSIVGNFNGIGDGTKVTETSIEVAGTGQAQESVNVDTDVRFGQNKTVSLLAQGIGGTGTGIATMRIQEDW